MPPFVLPAGAMAIKAMLSGGSHVGLYVLRASDDVELCFVHPDLNHDSDARAVDEVQSWFEKKFEELDVVREEAIEDVQVEVRVARELARSADGGRRARACAH